MEQEIEKFKSEVIKLIKELRSFFETQNIKSKRNKLNNLIEDPKFWDDRKKAEKILKEKKGYDNLLDSHKQSEREINELYDIFKLAR